ncbi:unnamed protein product [Prorocentrum cordatum]|uniref:Uncharacterized protein n=1 Tax=Prorocentrum cordatum TaxID=2364126 RepID=A0ABN9RVM4_9DINO|nr:unnamed protein product [Polarella glacialis]
MAPRPAAVPLLALASSEAQFLLRALRGHADIQAGEEERQGALLVGSAVNVPSLKVATSNVLKVATKGKAPCDPTEMPEWAKDACDKNTHVRVALVRGISCHEAEETKADELLAVVAKVAADPEAEVRAAVAFGWSLRHALAKDSKKEVRVAVAGGRALQAAFAYKPTESWAVLANLSDDADNGQAVLEVREAAIKARVELAPGNYIFLADENEEGLPFMTKLASDPLKEVRSALVAGPGLLKALKGKPNEAVAILRKLAADANVWVREKAAGRPLERALNQRFDELVPLLKQLLRDGTWPARTAAAGGPLCKFAREMSIEKAKDLVEEIRSYQNEDTSDATNCAAATLAAKAEKAEAELQAEIAKNETAKAAAAQAEAEEQARIAKEEHRKAMAAEEHANLLAKLAEDEKGKAADAQAEAKLQAEIAKNETAKAVAARAEAAAIAKNETAKAVAAQAEAEAQAEVAKNEMERNRRLHFMLVLLCAVSLASVVMAWHGQRLRARCRLRRRAARIERQLQSAKAKSSPTSHDFYFVDAAKIRAFTGVKLPHCHELRSEGWLSTTKWSMGRAIRGAYENYIVISHRWHTPGDPDTKGQKLKVLQKYLRNT